MRLALSLGFLLTLAACDTLGPDTELIDLGTLSQDADALVGTWEWTQSAYYETLTGEPNVETPASSGRTHRWTFGADGRARFYTDGELARETTYEVSRHRYSNGTIDERPSLRIDGGSRYGFGTRGDLLVLDSTPVDGPQERYTRK